MTGRAVPTKTLETELELALDLGVVGTFELRTSRRQGIGRGKRLWTLVLADGTTVSYGPKTLEAFMLGVRGTHEVREGIA